MGKALSTRSGLHKTLGGSACALIASHYSAFFTYSYWRYPWLDIPMHTFAGAWVALVALYIFTGEGFARPSHWVAEALLIWGFVALAGVSWEFIEFVADLASKDHTLVFQSGVADTMQDLFFDLLGGTILIALRGIDAARGVWQNHLS